MRALKQRPEKLFSKKMLPKPCRMAVEIGSYAGHWAKRFLEKVPNAKLWCVDPWEARPGLSENPKVTATQEVFELWQKNMQPWLGRRVWPIRALSEEAVRWFPFEIDLLMIDGDHREEAVFSDLSLWVPEMRKGGLVVGHDWTGHWGESVQRGVKRYVEALYKEQGIALKVASDHLVNSNAACFFFTVPNHDRENIDFILGE